MCVSKNDTIVALELWLTKSYGFVFFEYATIKDFIILLKTPEYRKSTTVIKILDIDFEL